MAADFSIGTRLIIDGHTFEVAECLSRSCAECASMDYERYNICRCLSCTSSSRADGREVHWKLISKPEE